MIDTHSHIYMPEFGPDNGAVVDRAIAAGVSTIVLAGVDTNSIQPIKHLHALRPEATAMACGLHPTEVRADDMNTQLQAVEAELQSTAGYVAIGETGIDLYWDQTTLSIQQEAFEAQMHWADKLGLPMILHVRNAFSQLTDVMKAHKGNIPPFVVHCFSGNSDDIKALRDIRPDAMFGIGGIVTFKKSPLPALLPLIGIDSILLETDAPWLAPVPHRGKQNESSLLPHINAKVAEIMNITPNESDRITSNNAQRFFNL